MFKSPLIMALTDWDQAEACMESECDTVFLLTGTMMDLPERVYQLQQANKTVFLHVDLITGIQSHTLEGMTYIAEAIAPDGIISTRIQSISHAKKLGLKTVQRIFLIDSHAMNKAVENCLKAEPDAVEAMPGIMPRVISEFVDRIPFQVVAGGLFKHSEEINEALKAGATAVSGSNPLLFSNKQRRYLICDQSN